MISFLKKLFSKPKSSETDIFLMNLLGFTPNKYTYYYRALTHSSVSKKKKMSNERLEFLGDTVLDVIVAEYLFYKYPNSAEGQLSKLKSLVVNRGHLNKLAKKIKLNSVINSDLNKPTESINGNALEALIGAIYLDQNFEITKKFIVKTLLKDVNIKVLKKQYRNYKGDLLEWCQKNKKNIKYKLAKETIIGSEKQFKIELFIDEILVSTAQHSNKKIAEKIAAKQAFSTIFVKSSTKLNG